MNQVKRLNLLQQFLNGTEYKEDTITVTLDENTDASDSQDTSDDSKKSDRKDKKDDSDAEESDSQDDSQDNSDDDNPFIKYFESQGFFR